jgi:hypothetical protein
VPQLCILTGMHTQPALQVIPPLERMWFPNDPALSYPPTRSWLSEKGKFPVEFGIPLLVAALAQIAGRSLVDW